MILQSLRCGVTGGRALKSSLGFTAISYQPVWWTLLHRVTCRYTSPFRITAITVRQGKRRKWSEILLAYDNIITGSNWPNVNWKRPFPSARSDVDWYTWEKKRYVFNAENWRKCCRFQVFDYKSVVIYFYDTFFFKVASYSS